MYKASSLFCFTFLLILVVFNSSCSVNNKPTESTSNPLSTSIQRITISTSPTGLSLATITSSSELLPTSIQEENTESQKEIFPKDKTVTPIATLIPEGVFVLIFYPDLEMTYSPQIWKDMSEYTNYRMVVNELKSKNSDTCKLIPLGPSGLYPEPYELITLGAIQYQFSFIKDEEGNLIHLYYLENESLQDYDYSEGFPKFVVIANEEELDTCRKNAEYVLETLRVGNR